MLQSLFASGSEPPPAASKCFAQQNLDAEADSLRPADIRKPGSPKCGAFWGMEQNAAKAGMDKLKG